MWRWKIPATLFEITNSFMFVEIPCYELNEIKSKHFLKNFHKFTNNSFRMVIKWKTTNIWSLFPFKEKKTIINHVLSIKGIVLVVQVTLVKPNVMQKWDGMNIVIQLKVKNHQNTFKATSTTILHGLSFQMLQENAKTRKNLEASYVALWKPDLNEQKDCERLVLFRNCVT